MKVKLVAQTQPLVDLTLDEYIIWCARISSPDNRENHLTAPKLMAYLMKRKHWSPFEMISFAFEIETSRAIAQQILRHRSFSFQEFSQRYAEVTNFETICLRYQTSDNRQSSSKTFEAENYLYTEIDEHVERSIILYQKLLADDVAKETARFILPLCTQTTLIMHGTLRSWIHFLEQRCDKHAQREIRVIAFAIREQLAIQIPRVAEALNWENLDTSNK